MVLVRFFSRSKAALALAALPLLEMARFIAKQGYVAFGIGFVPRAVRTLAPRRCPAGSVRFVVISDTHNRHGEMELPVGDVLLHCGDFTEHGTVKEIREFNEWLGIAAKKFKRRIVIAGNHDLGLDPDLDDLAFREIIQASDEKAVSDKRLNAGNMQALLTNCEYLVGEEAVPEQGIRIYGAPWTPSIGISGVFQVPGAYNRNPAKAQGNFKPTKAVWIPGNHDPYVPASMTDKIASIEECWDRVPEGVDILMTHGPPKDILDDDFGAHYGDATLNGTVERVAPRYHLFGHIHTSYGVCKTRTTTYINACSVTLMHDPSHAPIVFDIPAKTCA